MQSTFKHSFWIFLSFIQYSLTLDIVSEELFTDVISKPIFDQGELKWLPAGGFLLSNCQLGQISNHLICLNHYAMLAAFLNRTLVIAEKNGRHVDIAPSVNIGHLRSCYGEDSVLMESEFRMRYNRDIQVDEVLCIGSLCNLEDINANRTVYNGREYVTPVVTANFTYGTVTKNSLKTLNSLLEVLSASKGSVLTLGDIFRFPVKKKPMTYYFPFVRPKDCLNPLRFIPGDKAILAASNCVKSVFHSKRYMAFHWRRGDFVWTCDKNSQGLDKHCFKSLNSIAFCLAAKAKSLNIRKVFVATNADVKEMSQLLKILKVLNPSLKVFHLMNTKKNILRNFVFSNTTLHFKFQIIPFEKMLAAFSTVFLGTPISTFTSDIQILRYGFKTENSEDSFICDSVPFDK